MCYVPLKPTVTHDCVNTCIFLQETQLQIPFSLTFKWCVLTVHNKLWCEKLQICSLWHLNVSLILLHKQVARITLAEVCKLQYLTVVPVLLQLATAHLDAVNWAWEYVFFNVNSYHDCLFFKHSKYILNVKVIILNSLFYYYNVSMHTLT